MAKTIAFIPVRCGSKSIPMKNIKPLAGKPLVHWNIIALSEVASIDRIIISTDCDQIASSVQNLNISNVEVFERSEASATDTASTESAMFDFIERDSSITREDLFILVQATSPLTASHHFEEALEQYHNTDIDSLLTCVRTKRFFWNEDGMPENYDFQNRPRRQDFDGKLMENGAFYINTVKGIEENQNRLSGKIGVYEMPEHTSIEIDEEHDWIQAENLMHKYHPFFQKSKPEIKLFLSDVDGVLTDAGMYYTESGDELKKFSTHDGMGFELLRNQGIKTGIITSENTSIVSRRAKKLKVDYLYQGKKHGGKLEAAKEICKELGIELNQLAYIGDDINCKELLQSAGLAACPANALPTIKNIPGIIHLKKEGGSGAVREYVENYILA